MELMPKGVRGARFDVQGTICEPRTCSPSRLVPVLTEDPEGTPEVSRDVDRVLTAVARDASRGDRAARNALYFAFEPKIMRFVRRHARAGFNPSIEPADIAQEAFLVFADLVADWPNDDSFASFFFRQFPRRLAAAVRRLRGDERRFVRPNQKGTGVPSGSTSLEILSDSSAAAEEALARLEALAAGLPEPERSLLLWRIRDGERLGAIARRLGVSRGTVERAWKRLLADLRRSL